MRLLLLLLVIGLLFAPATTLRSAGEDDIKAGIELAKAGDHLGAYAKWRAAADDGNHVAMFSIAILFDNGWGVKQDDDEALHWYRMAADKGFLPAIHRVGTMYEYGRGVEQDYAEALRLYRKAADKGESGGMIAIGVMYEYGRGVEQDDVEALRWYRMAADKGVPRAMTNVGRMFKRGRGVKQDRAEALRWFRQAADKGDSQAMSSLGYMFYDGQVVERNLTTALDYFKKAMTDDYDAMRIWLCHGLLGKSDKAAASLKAYRDTHRKEGWLGEILRFMAGEITGVQLIELAKSDDAEKQNEQLCEAYFYVGSAELIAGNQDAAIDFFQKCVDTGVVNFSEHDSALAELQRLPPSNPGR